MVTNSPAYQRAYRALHREHLNKQAREKADARYRSDPAFRAAALARGKARDNHKANLRQAHGLTVEAYNAMVEAQDGRCIICGKVSKLFVDHDHSTGVRRGLLCNHCNLGLGHFSDDAVVMRRAADYVTDKALDRRL